MGRCEEATDSNPSASLKGSPAQAEFAAASPAVRHAEIFAASPAAAFSLMTMAIFSMPGASCILRTCHGDADPSGASSGRFDLPQATDVLLRMAV